MDLNEAKELLNQYGYSLVEAYGDASPAQMAGMKQRLANYIKTGSEFKIKSKANPLGLVVTVEKGEDGILSLINANTYDELAWAHDEDELIKKIYDIQANLGNIQKAESFKMDMVGDVNELLNKGQIVVIPDALYSPEAFDRFKSAGDMVYLHGEAEDDAGFDICRTLTKSGKPFTEEKRYDCVVACPKKGYVPSYLYFWYDSKFANKDFPYGLPRGLVCYKTDTEFCADAQKKLDSKSEKL